MSQAEQVILESKAKILAMDLKFGNLVVIELPPEVTDKSDEIVTRLNNWWIVQSPFFKGAKLMVHKHGRKVGLETDESLHKLGYVRLDSELETGETVREVLTNHLAIKNGSTHEEVGVSVQGSHDPLGGG